MHDHRYNIAVLIYHRVLLVANVNSTIMLHTHILQISAMKRKCTGTAPPTGGAAQRSRWATELSASSSSRPKSTLADYLLDAWSWGRMSAIEVQRIASRAMADGLVHPDIATLAGLGTSGAYPNNVNQELQRKVNESKVDRALFEFNVKHKVRGFALRTIDVDHAVILPHELFAIIFQEYHHVFVNQMLGGNDTNTAKFWDLMADHPSMVNHPVKMKKDFAKYAVPISVHGDGVAVSGMGKSWSRSVDVYSWASMLATGETIVSNYLIYCMYPKLMTTEAVDKFWKIVQWSLYWLFIGRWPRKDVNGNDWPAGSIDAERAGKHLAGGYFATVFCIRADLEHMALGFGFPWPTSSSPCGLCMCNTSDVPWTDIAPTAAWREQCWSNVAWAAANPDGHVLFTKVPGVCLSSFTPDIMHVCHLGVYQYVFGSVLKWLVCKKLPGTQNQNLQYVWEKIRDGYQLFQTKYRYNDLRLTMFAGPGFPQLKGKAAEVRGLALPLCKIVQDELSDDEQIHRWMKKLLLAIVQLEEILHRHRDDYRLPHAIAREFAASCDVVVVLNTALGLHFHGAGELYFNHTIKFHYLQHLGKICLYMNPRMAWCYAGEDLLQRVRTVVQSCLHGTKHAGVSPKVMHKYARALSFKLGGDSFLK